MGEKFVGSKDVVLHTWSFENTSGVGTAMDVRAEITELDLEVTSITSGPHVISVVTETGDPVHSFTLTDSSDQSALVSLGSIPGGRRIHAEWTVGGGGSIDDVTLTARETRSGIG